MNGNVNSGDEQRNKMSLLWDYSVYHSRWCEISENDFETVTTYEKGAESRIAVTQMENNLIENDNKIAGVLLGKFTCEKL